jgi:hypothetical protein
VKPQLQEEDVEDYEVVEKLYILMLKHDCTTRMRLPIIISTLALASAGLYTTADIEIAIRVGRYL